MGVKVTSPLPGVVGFLGSMAAAVLDAKIGASLLVMKAAGRGLDT